MKRLPLILSSLLAVCGLCLPLWLMHHGINYQDEPYQMLNAMEYLATPMAPLSAWFGHLWASWFGFTLISFRWLAVGSMLLSVGIAAGWLYRRTSNLPLSLSAFGLVATILALFPAEGYLYGWDCLSNLFLTITAVLCLFYIEKPRVIIAACIGMAAAVAVLARIPNLPIIVIALIVTYLRGQHRVFSCASILIAFLIISLGFIHVIYGSFSEYYLSWTTNTISGHSFSELLSGYTSTFTPYFGYLCIGTAAYVLCQILAKIVDGWRLYAAQCVGIGLIFSASPLPINTVSPTILFSLSALVVFSIVAHADNAVRIATISIAFLTTFGSDLGFEKMLSARMAILLAAYITADHWQVIKPWILTLAIFTLALSLSLQSSRSFEDAGFFHTNVRVESSPFAGVYTTPQRAAEIASLDSLFTSAKASGVDVLAVGDCFRYAIDLLARHPRPNFSRHQYLIDHKTFIPSAMTELQQNDSLRLVASPRTFDWRFRNQPCPRELSSDTLLITPKFIIFKR